MRLLARCVPERVQTQNVPGGPAWFRGSLMRTLRSFIAPSTSNEQVRFLTVKLIYLEFEAPTQHRALILRTLSGRRDSSGMLLLLYFFSRIGFSKAIRITRLESYLLTPICRHPLFSTRKNTRKMTVEI